MPDDDWYRQQLWYTWTGATLITRNIATGTGTTGPIFTTTSPATADVGPIWNSWQQIAHNVYRTTNSQVTFGGLGTNRALTAEEREAREDRRRRVEEKRAREEAAQYRAQILLRSVLTDGQWAAFLATSAFTILGSDGVTYLIENGVSGNIIALDSSGEPVVRYCVHPELWDETHRAHLPTADVLVAQTLGLRTNAEEYLRKANVHWRRRPPRNTQNGAAVQGCVVDEIATMNQDTELLRDTTRFVA